MVVDDEEKTSQWAFVFCLGWESQKKVVKKELKFMIHEMITEHPPLLK